jgi:hypothetical protein
MHPNRYITGVFIVCMNLLCGCIVDSVAIRGSGVSKSETREVGSFERVEIGIPVEIVIVKGDECTLELTMDENLLEHVTTTVENGRLRVASDQNLGIKSPAVLKLTSPTLTYVSLVGSVNGTIEELNGVLAELDIAGSSTIELGVQAEKLSVGIVGAGKVIAKGTCKELEVSISGSGSVRSEETTCSDASISIAGSGTVFVNAANSLDVSIAGSGDVRYRGQPTLQQSVAGSGKISRLVD